MERTERIWGIHDPHIFQDEQSGNYYVYCTEGKIHRSKDLVYWKELGVAVKDFPKEATAWTGTTQLWAPDIIKVGKEYRLYCSNSAWGVRKSCIFLAVADKPEGPFRYRGIVVRTDDVNSPCNAIDANPIVEEGTGRQFMAYGSFWGGIYLIELDPETGLAKNGPDDYGHCIAARPNWMDAAIEGAYIRYNPDTEYYYLFVSYGSLLSDYNIRLGRAKNIEGPYLDQNGRCLAVPNADNKLDDISVLQNVDNKIDDILDSQNVETVNAGSTCEDQVVLNHSMDQKEDLLLDLNNEIGYLLLGSFLYENRDNRWHGIMGPGHNSVLHDQDGSWYLVHHARPLHYTHGVPSFMQVRKLYWMENGWPVVAPVMYAGDEVVNISTEQSAKKNVGDAKKKSSKESMGERANETMKELMEELAGVYLFLEHKPQAPQLARPMSEMILYPDGTAYYARTIRYTWKLEQMENGATKLVFSTATHSMEAILARGYEDVLQCETYYFTGMSSQGCEVWGVKLP